MKIAFLGDSITFGYALKDTTKRYSTIVANALGMEEENYGITGTLMAKAGLNTEDGKDFVSRLPLIFSADVAVIFGGTNDYFWSDKTIDGTGDEYFKHALTTIAEGVKKYRNGKPTLFVTPYPHHGHGNALGGDWWRHAFEHDTSAVNFNGHTLQDYVNAIEEVCQEEGLYVLNLHKDFPFDWKKHTIDGCHPNETGHQLIADTIVKKLKELL